MSVYNWPVILSSACFPSDNLFTGLGSGAGVPDIAAGQTIIFDRYVNLFPAHYFAHLTTIKELHLSVEGSGSMVVEIINRCHSMHYEVGREEVDLDVGKGGLNVQLDDDIVPGGWGSLIVKITALAPCQIEAIEWSTGDAPIKPLNLSIGITTFNRAHYLTRTLQSLSKVSADFLVKIFVVNQGTEAVIAPDDSRIEVISQENLGGAGGFSRSIVEAIKAQSTQRYEGLTHHLLMDDDITIEPLMLKRSAFFLAHTNDEVAIGAQMLGIENQKIMSEFGVRYFKSGRRKSFGQNFNLDEKTILPLLEKYTPIDAHAWWFWLCPLSAFKAHGLALPVFIKGDDLELTDRYARVGVKTIALPALCVLHPRIVATEHSWQFYYLRRNEAIRRSLLPYHGPGKGFAFFACYQAIVLSDYLQSSLTMAGLEDYSKGPEFLISTPPQDIHHQVQQQSGLCEKPQIISRDEWNALDPQQLSPITQHSRPLIKGLILVLSICVGLVRCCYPNRKTYIYDGPHPPSPLAVAGRCYGIKMKDDETYKLYKFSKQVFIKQLTGFLPQCFKFMIFHGVVRRKWQSRIKDLTASAMWEKHFAHDSSKTHEES